MNTLSAARTLAEKATTAYQSVDGFLKCEGISDAPVTLAYRFNSPGAAEQFKFSQDITHAPGVRTISLSDGCLVMETRPGPQPAHATEPPDTAARDLMSSNKVQSSKNPGCFGWVLIFAGVSSLVLAFCCFINYGDAQKDAELEWERLDKAPMKYGGYIENGKNVVTKAEYETSLAAAAGYNSPVERITATNRTANMFFIIFFLLCAGLFLMPYAPYAWRRYKAVKSKQPNKLPSIQ